tara:strand:- start:165 stop:365 length:201 start_codon:yes stop_codon:yes gene_type:complete
MLEVPQMRAYNYCMMNEMRREEEANDINVLIRNLRNEREMNIRIESISLGIVIGCVVTVLIMCIAA